MTRDEIAEMLNRYDTMRHELRMLERELTKACTDYGRTIGIWGFHRDHLRMQLEQERKVS